MSGMKSSSGEGGGILSSGDGALALSFAGTSIAIVFAGRFGLVASQHIILSSSLGSREGRSSSSESLTTVVASESQSDQVEVSQTDDTGWDDFVAGLQPFSITEPLRRTRVGRGRGADDRLPPGGSIDDRAWRKYRSSPSRWVTTRMSVEVRKM